MISKEWKMFLPGKILLVKPLKKSEWDSFSSPPPPPPPVTEAVHPHSTNYPPTPESWVPCLLVLAARVACCPLCLTLAATSLQLVAQTKPLCGPTEWAAEAR